MRWRALRCERALATSEYAGILAMLAAVFLAVFALGLDGRIATTIETAVCQILGGECGEEHAAAPEKCLTTSTTTSANANVLIAVVQVDKDSILIREDYSDGSSTFTILDNSEVAGEVFAGVKGKIDKYGIDYSAEALAGVGLEGAQVFEFDNQEDADAFQETVQAAGGFDGILRDIAELDDEIPIVGWDNPFGGTNDWILDQLGVDDNGDLPTPTQTYTTGSLFIDGEAGAGAGIGALDAELAALIHGAGAVKVNTGGRDKGDAEVSFELEGEVNGGLGAAIFGGGVNGSGESAFTATLHLDAQNGYKPDKLVIKGSAQYSGAVDLHLDLKGDDLEDITDAVDELTFSSTDGEGHGIEFTGELDLNDPENLAAALGVLTNGTNPAGVVALVDRFDEDGTLSLDTFDLEKSETEGEVKVGLGIGGGAGGSSSSETESGRTGVVRPPGGTFAPRVCAQPS
jgi:hypothetical protein